MEPKTFGVFIDTENETFQKNSQKEFVRIFLNIIDRIERGDDLSQYQTIFDSNGNDVGRFAWKNQTLRLKSV